MEPHLSVSQSLQASTIIQQQQLRQGNGVTSTKSRQTNPKQSQHLSFWQQCRLSSALLGVEGTTAFEQINTYVSLQYLGVPVALMSLNGIIAGVAAVILIPTVGFLIDKGDNPKRRKRIALVLGIGVLLAGCLLLVAACSLKIMDRRNGTGSARISLAQLRTDTINRSDAYKNSATTFNQSLTTSTLYLLQNLSINESWSIPYSRKWSLPNITFAHSQNVHNKLTDRSAPTAEGPVAAASSANLSVDVQEPPPSDDYGSHLTLAGILGICGFSFLDIGFDVGNPMVRAFILDHCPPTQHTQILVTATLHASIAGLFISSIGILDIPSAVETITGFDGTAGAFIFYLCLVMTIIVIFFGCSMFAGQSISRAVASSRDQLEGTSNNDCDVVKYHENHVVLQNSQSANNSYSLASHQRYRSLSMKSSDSVSGSKHVDHERSCSKRLEISTSSLTNSNVQDKYSLLPEPCQSSYQSFPHKEQNIAGLEKEISLTAHTTTFGDFSSAVHPPAILEEIPEHPTSPKVTSSSFSSSVLLSQSTVKFDEPDSNKNSKALLQVPDCHDKPQEDQNCSGKDTLLVSDDSECNASDKTPLIRKPKIKTSRGQRSDYSNAYTSNCSRNPKSKSRSQLMNKRLVILVACTALSTVTLVGVVMYSPNVVTLGIYGGDPSAIPGTFGNERYRQGLRASSFGNVLLYLSYSISCALNNKSYQLLGEKMYYLICQGAMLASTAILIWTQTIEAYFVLMVVTGPFRTCIFTLPFVLANKFTLDVENQGEQLSSQAGRVTAIIGTSLPCTYIVMSSLMGPVISATGNVWVPTMCACIGCSVSMVVFSLLFCVNN